MEREEVFQIPWRREKLQGRFICCTNNSQESDSGTNWGFDHSRNYIAANSWLSLGLCSCSSESLQWPLHVNSLLPHYLWPKAALGVPPPALTVPLQNQCCWELLQVRVKYDLGPVKSFLHSPSSIICSLKMRHNVLQGKLKKKSIKI